jgi:integrase
VAPRLKFDKKAKRPKDIDLIIPGLGLGEGRNTDRFRASSEVWDLKEYKKRQVMIRDLADRLQFSVLRARLEGRFTTADLWRAYRGGKDVLEALCRASDNERLAPLLARYEANSTARDKAKTRIRIQRFIDWSGGVDRATTVHLTTARFTEFLNELTSLRHHRGDAVKGATKNRYRAALAAFCTYLIRQGHISKHPTAYRALKQFDEGDHRMPELTASEYRAYFETLHVQSPSLVPVVRMLVHTGADVGEVFAATVRHCDLERIQPRIRLRRTKTRTIERQTPFPIDFVPELRAHIAANALRLDDALFGMFTRASLDRAHQRCRRHIGREDLRLKDLRHIAAIAWMRGDAGLEQVKNWLGHSTINQTIVYANFAPDDDFDAGVAARAVQTLITEREMRRLPAVS